MRKLWKDMIMINWGKIGNKWNPHKDTNQVKKLGRLTPEKRKEVFDSLVASKLKKGYREKKDKRYNY